ncbi:BAG family molecular chaperone regulator 3-like isoform X2 [Anneissia japonica]|uniref:BAG family molecular chaperone regulator 3-like isoform X2 n=1 Tax=Anneissia japonica TaxID=1529436 RepID=UPI0014256628|nr:BAG family molecular chaperone regulator 3-like isoform X2 [Anneissia japonica]
MATLLNNSLLIGEMDRLNLMSTMHRGMGSIFDEPLSDKFHWHNRPITRGKNYRSPKSSPVVQRRHVSTKSPSIFNNEKRAPLRVESPELRRQGMVLDDVGFSMPLQHNGNHDYHNQHESGLSAEDFTNNLHLEKIHQQHKSSPKSKQRNHELDDEHSAHYVNHQFNDHNGPIFPEVEESYRQSTRNGRSKNSSPLSSRELRSGALHVPKRPPIDTNDLYVNGFSASKKEKQTTPEPMSPISPERLSFFSSAHLPPNPKNIPIEIRSPKSQRSKNQTFVSTAEVPRSDGQTFTEPRSPRSKRSNSPRLPKNDSTNGQVNDNSRSDLKDTPPNLIYIRQIHKEAESLGQKVVGFSGNKKDKEYLVLEEMLMRKLLELDKIETHGDNDIRSARKKAVHTIQQYLELLESKVKT